MIGARGRVGLPKEAGRQQPDGDVAAQSWIVGAERFAHAAHAARADPGFEATGLGRAPRPIVVRVVPESSRAA